MDKLIQPALLLSILLNLVALSLGSIFVVKRGGLQYLINTFLVWQRHGFRKSMYDNLFYRDKTSHFEHLPKSDVEIILLGDSLTDLCEWAELFPSNQIKNRGICGDTTDGILNRLANIVEFRPQKLFIMIGINDLGRGRQVAEIVANYQAILETTKEQLPDTRVFIQSVLPVNYHKSPSHYRTNEQVIALNTRLKDLAAEFSFHYIDLYSYFLDSTNQLDAKYTSDGVHLNGEGYLIWKEIIEENIVN